MDRPHASATISSAVTAATAPALSLSLRCNDSRQSFRGVQKANFRDSRASSARLVGAGHAASSGVGRKIVETGQTGGGVEGEGEVVP